MKKIILAVSMALALSACNSESGSTVSLDGYWSKKDSFISPEKFSKMESKLGQNIKRVLDSPAEMIYEVHLKSGNIVYVSYDLSIIIKGNMYRTSDKVNETNLSRTILKAEKEVENVLNANNDNSHVSPTVAKNPLPTKQIEDVEFTDFADQLLAVESNTSPIANSRIKDDQDFEKLRKKIKDNIDKRRKEIAPIQSVNSIKTTSNEITSSPLVKHDNTTNPAPIIKNNKYRTKSNMDVNFIKDEEKQIKYKNTVISKIGYDNKGNKLPESEKNSQMLKFIDNIRKKGDNWSMVYQSTGTENKGEIVVFTDPTCGFCKKFHGKLNEITDKGYSVRYLFYPRYLALGLDHPDAQKNLDIIKSIWCADDRKKEAHSIYVENTMAGNTCENKPVENKLFPATDHYFLGLIAGVKSTPSIILPNGKLVTGFNSTMAALK